MAGGKKRSSKAPRRKTTARKKTGAGGRRRRSGWLSPVALRRAGRIAAALAFVAGFALSSWVLRLDRIVVARFEGQRFEVPSKVLSAPTILYPGLDWRRIGLRETLERMGYREVAAGRPLPPGNFHWGPRRLRVHLRAFDHPSRPEPERDIVIGLSATEIEMIRELPRGREVGAVLLEPELVGAYYGLDREQRDLVRLPEVPPHLVHAILSVEDQRFETHHGIDLRRIAGAFVANLRAGSIRQGGSTLTQQLVKNFFLTPERTLSRKLQEADHGRAGRGPVLEGGHPRELPERDLPGAARLDRHPRGGRGVAALLRQERARPHGG